VALVGKTIATPRDAAARAATLGWGYWLSALSLLLLVAGGVGIEQARPRVWEGFWTRLEAATSRLPLPRLLLRLARAAAVPLFILLAWSIAGLFTAAESPWFTLAQALLAIWVAYRVLDHLLPGPERDSEAEDPPAPLTLLRVPLHRLLVFSAVWLGGWLAMDLLEYRPEVAALWIAAGHFVLVLLAFLILVRRRLLASLLPYYEHGIFPRLAKIGATLYTPLVYFSLLIALLWVVGYQNLASVFLARSWALVGIWLFAFVLFHSLTRVAERSIDPAREYPLRREALLVAMQRLFGFVLLVFVYVLSLRVVGLWAPWRHLREQTWLTAGSIHLTGDGLWISVLVTVFLVLVSRWLQATLDYYVYPRMGIGPGEAYALNRLLHYAMMVAVALLVLNNLGLSPTSLALVAGGLSVGLGFGLQNIANNLASGLILLTSRQVRQGDLISVGDQTGVVREVNLRATTVTTGDNLDLLIPNSKLLEETLINWTHGTSHVRLKVPFGVAYSQDPAAAEAAAMEVAVAHPEVLEEPPPEVWFRTMGGSALEFDLAVWIDLKTSIRPRVVSQLLHALFRTFQERDIEVPFPQQDVHLRSGIPWEALLQSLRGSGSTPPERERVGTEKEKE
jgi:small-conductance mechanosensitive channel